MTRAALAEGRIHEDQAQVILGALADLPDDLDPEIKEKAEAHLLEQAKTFDAKALEVHLTKLPTGKYTFHRRT